MKFKKLISVLLTAVCVLSLAACGSKGDSENGSGSSSDGSGEGGSDSAAVTAKVINIDLTDE